MEKYSKRLGKIGRVSEQVEFYITLDTSFWGRVFPGNHLHWYRKPNSKKQMRENTQKIKRQPKNKHTCPG